MSGTLIIIQPTQFCNIYCKYCYLPNRNNKERLSLHTFEKILEKVFNSKHLNEPFDFAFHVGEPLVVGKKFYWEASKLIKQYGEKYKLKASKYIQTNAILIDEEWAGLFKDNNFRLGVSIDGPDFIHDRNRITRNGRNTHEKVMRGIAELQKGQVDFSVIMVLTTFALDYPEEIYDFFVKNQIKYVGFNIDEFGANEYQSSYKSEFENNIVERYKQFMRQFLYLVDRDYGKLSIREFSKIGSFLNNYAHGQIDAVNAVNVPLSIVNFDVNGNFSTFCPELLGAKSHKYQDFIFGNIDSMEIDDILNTPKFIEINRDIQLGVSKCKQNCDYWVFCGGGAPSNKYYETGLFDIDETLNCKIHTKALVDIILEYINT